ncbi:ABC transporter permease [Pseudobacter ginsenosidimutans]|uniref:FtsX-like permease family protein n=1 Tax=Pseudobacter ginsenosidimutans TaxID=661488 RepID=A0A4Q7N5C3_9BACT|nr:ABC transporter permease [Pseudobacter ginsenosidimutans]QEC44761.1 FtsX-like permease family protein [Pseudobacter ginsenosidimutans]RZS76245.1 FtsX-like permease family protein [Pseudobacter ginsenosidimutans]
MFRNYFKTAWRNLLKNKAYSAINVFGLAAGMTVTLLIGLWVFYQYSYNEFLPDHGRLYRVQRNFNSNGDTLTFRTSSLRLADALRDGYDEIEAVAETDWMGPHGLMVGDKKIYQRGGMVGTEFLKMFGFPLLKGNAGSVLNDPYSIVLTESTAKALFGNEDPLNKMVRIDNKNDLKVTGILKDIPGNSTLQFKYLVPFSYKELSSPRGKLDHSRFDNNGFQVFVKLKKNIPYSQLAPKIRMITHTQESMNAKNSYVTLQQMDRWHLYSNYVNGKDTEGFLEYVRIFTLVGLLVLLIACINFVNLTTARSEKRAREVGVRKAIGSAKKQLVFQFLLESFLLILIAFSFALLLVQLLLPAFNILTEASLQIPYSSLTFWSLMAALVLITTLVAGSRPAFYLSSFQPVKVLKGSLSQGRSHSLFRKTLVVVQFSCSVALIIGTIVIYRQINYAKDRPNGYELARLMELDMNPDLLRNYNAFKNEAIQSGIVSSMTTASSPATDIYWHSDIEHWPGKKDNETIEMGVIITTPDYFKTMGMELIAGRDFRNEFDSVSVIFNEAAINKMRIKDPVNQVVRWQDGTYVIAGVAKDALMLSPFGSADPTMFLIDTKTASSLLFRIAPGVSTQGAISKLNTIFNKYSPAFSFEYSFADETHAAKFKMEMLIGKLAAIFAMLAIFISCLGLFGLAAYIAEQRTREIGIRKVLGASMTQLLLLLTKDFLLLVLISCVIASPLALWFLEGWLKQYSYRINIGAMVFIWAALIALVIAVVVISFQTLKAAMMSPVKSLKSE